MTPGDVPSSGPFAALCEEFNRPIMRAMFWFFMGVLATIAAIAVRCST